MLTYNAESTAFSEYPKYHVRAGSCGRRRGAGRASNRRRASAAVATDALAGLAMVVALPAVVPESAGKTGATAEARGEEAAGDGDCGGIPA